MQRHFSEELKNQPLLVFKTENLNSVLPRALELTTKH